MSPSMVGIGVSLGTEDFLGVNRQLGDQLSTWVESAAFWNGVAGEDREEADVITQREASCKSDVNTVPNVPAISKLFLQRDYKLTQEMQSLQTVDSMCVTAGECAMTSRSVADGKSKNESADQIMSPKDTTSSSLNTQGSVTPLVASKTDAETKQHQRTRTPQGLHSSPSAGRIKDHGAKNFSGNVSANTAFGFFGNTSAGRPSLPSAAATPRAPPRPWEVRVLLLAFLLAASVNGRYDRGGLQHSITWGRGNTHNSAVFGNAPSNVTAVLGHRASLPCQVKNLGHKDVSWIRQRDLHILTVGIFTYTSDDRFKVFHPPETEDWFLEISSVTFRDSGVYECQVSTSPKVSLPITLTVLAVQQAEIPGPHEVFIQHGSTISLQCEVRAGVEAVGLVRWYHGDKPLNYSSPRGGISMEVEKTPTMTTSKLYITRAVKADIGNYTCAPKFSRPDSVFVHVVNAGEESAAAVQSGVMGVRACMGVLWMCVIVAFTALSPEPLLLLPRPRPRRL